MGTQDLDDLYEAFTAQELKSLSESNIFGLWMDAKARGDQDRMDAISDYINMQSNGNGDGLSIA